MFKLLCLASILLCFHLGSGLGNPLGLQGLSNPLSLPLQPQRLQMEHLENIQKGSSNSIRRDLNSRAEPIHVRTPGGDQKEADRSGSDDIRHRRQAQGLNGYGPYGHPGYNYPGYAYPGNAYPGNAYNSYPYGPVGYRIPVNAYIGNGYGTYGVVNNGYGNGFDLGYDATENTSGDIVDYDPLDATEANTTFNAFNDLIRGSF